VKLRSLALAAGALLLAGSSGAAAATHIEEVASLGSVQATFSYDVVDDYDGIASNQHLTIIRAGAVLLDAPIPPLVFADAMWPANYWLNRKSVLVGDFDGDGEPEVFVELLTGGAHCCFYDAVYRYTSGSYLRSSHWWGNQSYRLEDLDGDGRPEFVSADDRFSYAFSCFACSRWPPQIWSYRGGRFLDVTRRFPRVIRRDARQERRDVAAWRRLRDNSGPLAAWTADECLLQNCAQAWRQLEAWRRHQWIYPGDDRTPRAYLRHLRRFLHQTGYLR
jgi:hypothetical protein